MGSGLRSAAGVRSGGGVRSAAGVRRTVAAGGATVLASFALYPVYSGSAWWWAGAGAAASVAGAGTLTRRWRLPVAVCLLGGLAGLLLYLNLVFSRGRSLAAVLPTPSSLGSLAGLAAQGIGEAGRYAPPAPEQGGLMLLAAGGIGLTGLLVDLIAVRLGSAALAGLPLLLLFAEPFTLSINRGPLGTAAVFCLASAGYLTLLAVEGGERIRSWERPKPGRRPGDRVWRSEASGTGLSRGRGPARGVPRVRPPDTRALAAAGRRVGAASVAAALCVPLFAPGLHVTRLFGGGSPGAGGSVVGFPDPRTQISRELRSTRAVPVLTYTSTAQSPGYLQVYVLNALTSQGWQIIPGDPQGTGNGTDLTPPGLTSDAAAPVVSTRISVSGRTGPDALGALPVPYPPVRVTAPGAVRADRDTLMVFDRAVTLAGLHYSVSSRDVIPAAGALAAAAGPPAARRGDLEVPRSYAPLRALARRITRNANAATPYRRAVALQDWLADGNFSYSLAAPSVTTAAGLENFLERTRTGYCQQFSYAMAVLARLEGIPARVVYGFTQGTRQRDGRWLVTTHDAHAWPELYFDGYGWLRFEPTPGGAQGQGTAVTPAYSAYAAPSGPASPSPGTAGPTVPSQTGNGGDRYSGGQLPPAGGRRPFPPGGSGGTGSYGRPAAGVGPWPLAGLSAAALLLAAAALPALARLVIRRRRWRIAERAEGARGGGVPKARAGARRAPRGGSGGGEPPAQGVRKGGKAPLGQTLLSEAAWRELLDDLTDYRAGGPASESPRALARRVAGELGLSADAAAALRRVTTAAERALYSAQPADGATLRRDCGTVRRAVAASVPRRRRWRARVFPPSVMPASPGPWAPKVPFRGRRRSLPLAAPGGNGGTG